MNKTETGLQTAQQNSPSLHKGGGIDSVQMDHTNAKASAEAMLNLEFVSFDVAEQNTWAAEMEGERKILMLIGYDVPVLDSIANPGQKELVPFVKFLEAFANEKGRPDLKPISVASKKIVNFFLKIENDVVEGMKKPQGSVWQITFLGKKKSKKGPLQYKDFQISPAFPKR